MKKKKVKRNILELIKKLTRIIHEKKCAITQEDINEIEELNNNLSKFFKSALYFYKVIKVVRIVDGDTIDFLVDLGFNTYKKVRVRLFGINTPEIRGPNAKTEYKQGIKAKQFVEKWLSTQKTIYIKTYKDRKGRYGRYLAKVYNENGECLNDILVENNLAEIYEKN